MCSSIGTSREHFRLLDWDAILVVQVVLIIGFLIRGGSEVECGKKEEGK